MKPSAKIASPQKAGSAAVAKKISPYIGETEKNLARLTKRAETSEAALLLDEADALFGKRTDIKDAHDRYANQAIKSPAAKKRPPP